MGGAHWPLSPGRAVAHATPESPVSSFHRSSSGRTPHDNGGAIGGTGGADGDGGSEGGGGIRGAVNDSAQQTTYAAASSVSATQAGGTPLPGA